MRFGFITQINFIATYLLPISIYFFVRFHNIVTAKVIHYCLCIFVLTSFIFLGLEFSTTNFIGIPIFAFSSHWDSVGVENYHASKVSYPVLGLLLRPWGLMAMPQATGSVFAAFFIYFLSKHHYSSNFYKSKSDPFFAIISFLGLFISGSRTAIITMVLLILILYRRKIHFYSVL